MDATKFEKVVLMLSSDQAGEVFAAAQAIGRALPASGLDWHKFAKLVAGRLAPKEKPAEPAYREEYRAEYNDGNYVSKAEIEIINSIVQMYSHKLTETERAFVEGLYAKVSDYGLKSFISAKQRAWLNRIWERV